MSRIVLTLLCIASLCFGTGAMHLACACCDGPPSTDVRGHTGAASQHHTGCCSTPPLRSNVPETPCDDDPERCPCLYWNSLPLSTSDTSPGALLLKRSLGATPFLLLEAAPLSLRHVAAVTPRDGPRGPRYNGARLQAWTCVWTI